MTERDQIGSQAHRRPRRIHIGAARDVFLEDIVLHRPAELRAIDFPFVGHRDVKAEQDCSRGIDRHRSGDAIERNVLEEQAHVLEGANGDARASHRPSGAADDLGRDPSGIGRIECHRQARLALREQEPIARIRLRSAAEARVLTHGPQAAPVIVGWTPRVNGICPGSPRSRS